ncbi:MAG: hypothetical protein M3Y87_29090, partial [Myxococcota bacterium]|nr:hypothetical protein [Myxococcota bacterium]
MSARGRVGVWTIGLARNPHLRALLGADELVLRPGPRDRVDCVVGWGRKANTEAPRRFARERSLPFLTLEDGFVRSLSLGVSGDPPLSIVVDDVGIYYDATGPSAIEQRLASIDRLADDVLARARRAIDALRREQLSKYNDAPVRRLPPSDRPRVLVVDQTAGDLSIALGAAGERPFDRMLEAALDENPGAEIVVKTHPDVVRGKRRASFTSIPRDPRITLFAEAANPIALLEDVERVYVVTSLMGLEALLSDKRVTCFGVPFYAGWGLTDDRGVVPARRGAPRSIEHVFAEAYLSYARYVDPETGERCELERVIEHLALQRRTAEGGGQHFVCVGFSAWKRAFVPSFLGGPLARVDLVGDARAAERKLEDGSRLVVWGTREGDDVRALAERSGAPLCRMEDGFLRSVGLGSDLNAPASLVLDASGIYYDPRTPSALETILEARAFSDAELERARALRERIVAVGISKYNLGERRAIATARGDREVVLVVGQVEDDASIRLGCVDVRTNEELLREARRARPDAYVIWKPHPDVVRGNREGAVEPERARAWADEIVADVALADCLAVAHEVHTMTSLVGFEALLRGLRVVVYGQPFYAGWGLTADRHPHPRRTARLTLDELVAGTLLRYPRYVSATTQRFSTPERIVDELIEGRRRARDATSASWTARELAKVKNLARTLFGARSAGAVTKAKASPTKARRAKTSGSSTIGELGCTSALLLQGPAGPFMHRLGRELRDAGVRTTKINFHAGDVLFYPGPDALAFRGELGQLGAFVRRVIEEREIDAIFLFGDCRAHHRIAIEVARALGVTVWAFEEGYLRPDWITLERGGVNGHSSLPRDPEVYRRAALPKPPDARKVGDSFGTMSWYSTLNALTFTHLNHGFPHYRHHRNLNAWFHTFSWVRGAARKELFRRQEAPILPRLTGELSGRFFLAVLQVHCDFQLVHSKYRDVVEFIHEVVATFAEHADPRDTLVIKHHPMDRPFREYGPLMRELARAHGLGDRLIYVHDLHLPTLLEHARGTITINSTTALQSFHHGTPVKAMGDAIYDLPGLTFQGELAAFLREPGTFDRELYESFRRWLLWHNQANGSFYVRPPGTTKGTGIRWPAAPDAPPRRVTAAPRSPTPQRGSKLAKLRNSPERFFAESKSAAVRALG